MHAVMTLGFDGEKESWVFTPAEGQHPAEPELKPQVEKGGRQQTLMVADVADRAAAVEVPADAAGLRAEPTPDRTLDTPELLLELPGLPEVGPEAGPEVDGDNGDGDGPSAGVPAGNVGTREVRGATGQSWSVEHMQLVIRLELDGENARLVTPPDGQHPVLL